MNNTKYVNINIGSVNCRSLYKQSQQSITDDFIAMLKNKKLNILLCQETNIPNHSFKETINNMEIKFKYHQAIWTEHCSIINFNNAINLEKIKISTDGRMILSKLTFVDNPTTPFYIMNIYAHSGHVQSQERNNLFKDIVNILLSMPEILPHLIMAGDFNYSFDSGSRHGSRTRKSKELVQFMAGYMKDCMNQEGEGYGPTCRQNRQGRISLSTIDYIFAGKELFQRMNGGDVEFFGQEFTDHALLTKTLTMEMYNCGKGIWRANPYLCKNKRYVSILNREIENYVQNKLNSELSTQDQWDCLKNMVKKVTTNFCRTTNQIRETTLKKLNSERNRILRLYRDNKECLNILLPDIETQITTLQKEKTDIARLRSGKYWMENNENSPSYIKRTIDQRREARTLNMIKHPDTRTECNDKDSKIGAAESFYSKLYTEERIDINCLDAILNHINKSISKEEGEEITQDISFEEIKHGAKRSPRKSSPGLDGLPYEILNIVMNHPRCKEIVEMVYNDALKHGIIPKSWQQACIILLPKKGDLSDLSNWRPISLINTDCKVFTRILNSRLMGIASQLINNFQTGFMPQRFIGDHGFSLNLMIENSKVCKGSNKSEFTEYVGIMLDNHKAYDRVHPYYLTKVLEKFGIPASIIQCIQNLFFNNEIFVNVNGFLTNPIKQKRGLRQGDAISPLLFNFAIEPFLLSILNNEAVTGYTMQSTKPSSQNSLNMASPKPIKLLAYADDILIFAKNKAEYLAIEDCLKGYSKASNSKINLDKSVAFPLHGSKMVGHKGAELRNYITNNQRMKWFDNSSTGYLKYLGYPLWFNNQQRDTFVDNISGKIQATVNFYKERKISVYGRATVANTMILSKLWHVLRLTNLPKVVTSRLNSIIYQYIVDDRRIQVKKDVFYLPKNEGGLGLLNISVQQKMLQLRYINALLSVSGTPNPVPSHLYSLMVFALQNGCDTPYHEVPLLFPESRYKSAFTGLHSFHNIFEAIDSCIQQCKPDAEKIKISPKILLSLPFTTICNKEQLNNESININTATIKQSKVQDFFQYTPLTKSINYKPRQECKKPKVLSKIIRLEREQHIKYNHFFQQYMENNSIENFFEESNDLSEYSKLIQDVNKKPLLDQKKKRIRYILNQDIPLIIPKGYNNNISKKQWTEFYKTNMHHTARNLWFKVIHNKIPSKSFLYNMQMKDIDSDKCHLCNLREDSMHLLISCVHKKDIWQEIFNKFLGYPRVINPQQTYHDFKNLKMSRYYIYNLDMHINIYDIFSTITRLIWLHHFNHVLNSVPFNSTIVSKKICSELHRMSNMNDL